MTSPVQRCPGVVCQLIVPLNLCILRSGMANFKLLLHWLLKSPAILHAGRT